MFWFGAAAGAFAVLVIIAGGMGVILWQVARDRTKETEAGDKYRVEKERLYSYWDECNELATEKNYHLKSIHILLREIAKIPPTPGGSN